ncbi:tRNA(Ile)-lysidine synthase [Thalassoglobus neptunius]|uniref:tRNA(Ile)-lysidine synthase n=1 Tax=Thalassoglobus neptunius TaxID=1938619 RepID=A0A5C5VAW7_9PLAN|nr:tRNA lysidine(34) synthetase TilS [Thalassoglobus neptunius]TWT34999.1 tRNA(Ile)-lysidine synthase [Thalassoglobus neptunius]
MTKSQHPALLSLVREFFCSRQIHETTVIVAVSGGADSLCLLSLLHQLSAELALDLHVGHFNHQLRPSAADDAEFVRSFCSQNSIPCRIGNPPSDVSLSGSENESRNLRYEWLQNLAADLSAPWIAVAHTQDDQVETILHHIVRGTGLRGLRGIPSSRKLNSRTTLIRPLLECTRAEIEALLKELGLEYRTDESNRDRDFTRNRIRHELLPLLKESFNPQVSDALLKLGKQADRAQQTFDQLVTPLIEQAVTIESADRIVIDSVQLAGQPMGLMTEVLVSVWRQANWPRRGLTFEHWSQLTEMIKHGAPRSISLPGPVQATRRKKKIELLFDRTSGESASK